MQGRRPSVGLNVIPLRFWSSISPPPFHALSFLIFVLIVVVIVSMWEILTFLRAVATCERKAQVRGEADVLLVRLSSFYEQAAFAQSLMRRRTMETFCLTEAAAAAATALATSTTERLPLLNWFVYQLRFFDGGLFKVTHRVKNMPFRHKYATCCWLKQTEKYIKRYFASCICEIYFTISCNCFNLGWF